MGKGTRTTPQRLTKEQKRQLVGLHYTFVPSNTSINNASTISTAQAKDSASNLLIGLACV
jgi:hypothetical protein